jgi:hypothetical protein
LQGTDGLPLAGYEETLKQHKDKLLDAASNRETARYYVKAGEALASIPSRCWAHAGTTAGITLHALPSNHVVAVSLAAACDAKPANSPDGGRGVDLAKVERIQIARPVAAPDVVLPADVASAQQQQQQMQQFTQQQQQQQDQVQQSGSDGKQGAPQKDERTWLQRNWMFVVAGLFIVANRFGQAQEGGDGGVTRTGGGAAGRR